MNHTYHLTTSGGDQGHANITKIFQKSPKNEKMIKFFSQNSQKLQNFCTVFWEGQKFVQKSPKNQKMINFFFHFSFKTAKKMIYFLYFSLKKAKKFKIFRTVFWKGQKFVQKSPKNQKMINFFSLFSKKSQKNQKFSHSGPRRSKNVQKSQKNAKIFFKL